MESAASKDRSHVAHTSILYRAMTRHPELFLLAITLSVTVISRYGNSLKSQPITVPPRPPKRFFPISSPVLDFPYGDLDPVVDVLGQEEIIFLMYYAPWCAKSMAVRWEFHKAAKYLKDQVKFVAVNCWWPEGQCRKRYKFLMYPVLFVYYLDVDGYRYMGLQSADHMVKFLEDLMYPLTPFHHKTEILDFIARHDSAVIGYFDFNMSPQPPGFQQFYLASMRVVEHDPHQPVKFGVTFQKHLAEMFNLTQSCDVVMLRVANSSLKFSRDFNFTSSQLVSWSLSNRQKPIVKWLSPLGVKSLSLSNEIIRGPAVIAFYSHNPLFDTNQPFQVMKDLALQFRNCGENTNISDIITRWRQQAKRSEVSYHEVVRFCDRYRRHSRIQLNRVNCCVTVVTSLENSMHKNICEYCVHRQNQTVNSCPLNLYLKLDQMPKWTSLQTNICQNSVENYNTFEYYSLCCRNCTKKTADTHTDRFSAQSFKSGKRRLTDRYLWQSLENYPKRLCKKLTLQKVEGVRAYRDMIHYIDDDDDILGAISGLGCHTNRTVNFYAMDAVHHSVFAERLGVDISSLPAQPSVVIVDKENEEEYLLKENFTVSNVASFIVNFTTGNIRRHLRSSLTQNSACDSQHEVCVTDVSSQTFQHVVMAEDKDVVVFIYSHWCGFCVSVAHNYLALARYFLTADNIVFTRFNADENDLPWELTVDTYPVILLFPAGRKADSVVFAENVEMTLPNLIRFVLQHSNHELRMHTALGVCSETCIRRNREYARRTRRDLEKKRSHLQGILIHLLSSVNISNSAERKYIEISVQFVKERLLEMSKEITDSVRLLNLLEASEGSEIDPLKLREFLKERKHSQSDGSLS